jgi:flagellar assembly protein FliH
VKAEIPLSKSKIIKAAPDQLEEVIPFDFAQMERKDRKHSAHPAHSFGRLAEIPAIQDPLRDVDNQIQKRLLEAERKAQELEEQAYQKGYEQGQKDGFEFGQRSMAIVKEHLERLLPELQGLPETLLTQYRDWLIDMCLSISRRIVRKEVVTDSSHLSQLIDTLLREAVDGYTLTVYVHPDDLNLLEKHLDLKLLAERSGRNFHLKADIQLDRGGCRMESDMQLLDASIEKQFSSIEQAMRKNEPVSDQIST